MAKHYKVLGQGVPFARLANVSVLKTLTQDLVRDCGMSLLGPPQVYVVDLQLQKLGKIPFEDEGGISCIGCLSTSHIAIHTWPLRGEYHLDIYSCREFQLEPVQQRLKTYGLGERATFHDLTLFCSANQFQVYALIWDPEKGRYAASQNGASEASVYGETPIQALESLLNT